MIAFEPHLLATASDQADIGFWGLATSGLLVAITVALSIGWRLGIATSVLWAAGRALVQLLLVGVALGLVIADNAPLLWSWIWVAVMLGFAAWTTQRRVGEAASVRLLSLAAFTTAAAISIGVLFGFGVFDLTGRALVPLAGMTIGNSLSTTVLVTNRVIAEARDRRPEIEARLALGLSAREAFAPHLRHAIRDALTPQIETTKAVGIIFLPGAMVGLILAGVEPTEAVKVQAAVMYLVLGSVATTASVMAVGLSRQLFTRDHRLRRTAPDRPATPSR